MTNKLPVAADVVAGLCVAGLLIPEAVAYAAIAGVRPSHALIAALVGLLSYGLIGGSRFAIVTPTSSSAAIFAAAIASMGAVDPAHRLALGFGLVLMTGVFFLLAAAAKLGHLAAFISRPVLKGFVFGLGITIVLRQLPHIAGIDIEGDSIWALVEQLFSNIFAWNFPSVLIGVGAFLLLIVLKRIRMFPAALLVIALGVVISSLVDLSAQSVALVGSVGIGHIKLSFPRLQEDEWLRLGELAFALLIILYAESWGSIRSLALRHNESVSANRELVALGVANFLSALVQGLPVGAGFSASATNEDANAASKFAGLIAALAMLILILSAGAWLAKLPVPVLAAVVIAGLLHTLDPRPLLGLWRINRDQYLATAATAGVIGLGVLPGMLIAVGLSLVAAIRRFSQSQLRVLGQLGDTRNYIDVSRNPSAQVVSQVMILRPEEPLFFANAERVIGEIHGLLRQHADTRVVVLSLEESGDLDSTAIEVIREFIIWLQVKNRVLLLARVKDEVRDLLRRAHILDASFDVQCYWSVADAVDAAQKTASDTIIADQMAVRNDTPSTPVKSTP